MKPRHLMRQGPVLRALGRAAWSAVRYQLQQADRSAAGAGGSGPIPGPELHETVPPRDPRLIRDYIRHVGGDPGWYRGVLPPHLFPQWAFPSLARTLDGLSYDVSRMLNAGCRMEVRQPLPADEPLQLRAHLEEVDDNGRRAIMTQQLWTGTASAPDALFCEVHPIIPLGGGGGGGGGGKKGKKKDKPRVPVDAREIDRWKLSTRAGGVYASLTGDINPIHWSMSYARMSGFRSVILHGFSGMARTIESLNRNLWSGRSGLLREAEFRLVRPIVLPARVGVYVDDRGGVWAGDAPGGPAYVTGTYTTRNG